MRDRHAYLEQMRKSNSAHRKSETPIRSNVETGVNSTADFNDASSHENKNAEAAPIQSSSSQQALKGSKGIDLAQKDSLTGSLLIARPELSLTLDNDDENEIPSPMFFVVDEIEIEGEQALVMILLNAPLAAENGRLKDVYPSTPDCYKNKTIFYGGNFGSDALMSQTPNTALSRNVQLLIKTSDQWLSLFPDHPYHKKDKKPAFMVIEEGPYKKAIIDSQTELGAQTDDFFLFCGYCLLPKDEINALIGYSDFYVLEDPSAQTVFSDHAASKYLSAFKEFGLGTRQISSTVQWAQDMRNAPKPH